jgi:tetratricopeptide (TPR) repeat protein
VGIPTAFITVPGHIYAAFALGEARGALYDSGDLILRDGEAWVPVEVTSIAGGFLQAWELGARQWRENEAAGKAGFIPMHEAWKLYEPVGFAGAEAAVELPAAGRVVESYRRELARIVERELQPQEASLLQQIRKSQEDPRLLNKLGLLYARFGRTRQAAEQFQRILARREYLPALVNLGNLEFLQKAPDKSLAFFERAYRLNPSHPGALLGLSRANYELERYSQTERWYALLQKADPGLAARFSYLQPRASEGEGRASEAQRQREVVVWQEE